MGRTILTALVACLLAAGSVSAATVSLDGTTLANFEQLSSSAPGITYLTDYDLATYASFSTSWRVTTVKWGTATVGLNNLSGVTWTNADTLSIAIRNDDENRWSFSFHVSDGVHSSSTGLISLAPDQTEKFSLSLAQLVLTGPLSVGVTVQSQNPWPSRPTGGYDRTAEYTLASVPVPPALWFLGSGLLGLVGMRKRLNKR